MKKIVLYDVPVGKSFVFHHRMYRRTNLHSPEGYGILYVPCMPIGVIHDNLERHLYRFTKVEV